MSVKSAMKELASGAELLPFLKNFIVQYHEDVRSGKRRKSELTLLDAAMTRDACSQRILDKEENNFEGDMFHPSALGTCKRQVWFGVMGAPSNGEPSAEDLFRSHLILETGTYIHILFQNLCDAAGILVKREVAIVRPDLKIIGHGDGIIKLPGKAEALLEIKSINTRGFTGLDDAKFEHKQQATAYMHALGLLRVHFVYLEKDRHGSKEFIYDYDPDFYEEHVKQRIIEHFDNVRTKTLPDREGSNPRAFPCGWCQFSRVCFESYELDKFMLTMKPRKKMVLRFKK